jgi:DNA processing protein
LLTLADTDYPQSLLSADDPPVLLYAKGDTALLNRPMLAVVGSRNGTTQGERDAEAFSKVLGDAGLTIVSGLALGIDAAAHRGGLATAAGTVAVIGTGADRLYPARNETLARAIAEKGVVLSEFPLGTPAIGANFPRRNRIIAGLGLGCLVVEAALRSGSLITARLAAESGREVFAIPGSIHSPLSRGCHQLIRQGAKLVESAQDILEDLRWGGAPAAPATAASTLAKQDGAEEQVLAFLGDAPCALDTLSARSGLTPADLLAMLLPMELAGRVAQLPGGLYQKLHS